MKSTQFKKWLALSLILGLFGVIKAQDSSPGDPSLGGDDNSGTC